VSFHPDLVQSVSLQQSLQSVGCDLSIDIVGGKEKQAEVQQSFTTS
jgi:hypothetical protein